VPISFRLAAPEAAFVVQDSGSTVLVVDDAFAPTAAAVRTLVPGLGSCLVNGPDPDRAGPGAELYHHAVAAAVDGPPEVLVSEHDPACIMYTSGTTGRPKGALLSHFNLFMNSVNSIAAQRLGDDDEVWYGVLPLFHIGGLNGILLYLVLGATSVIVPLGRFDPAQAVEDLQVHRVTSCCFVQMQWSEVTEHLGSSRPPFSLRRIVWGTSNAVIPVLEAMSRVFPGVPVYNFFGQTEMSSVTCVLAPEMFGSKMGSVGRPVMAVEARIVDDEMRDVAPGEVGEIVFRGPTVMQGYWGMPEATAEAFAGGWFHSGDLCRADDEGYIYVVDRKKDMIISGGENIYSAEVEAALAGCPGVAEVAVIGVPHDLWGETPMAVVVPADPDRPPSLDDLVEHVKELLASYKKPTQMVVAEALPRNAAGKVVKPELRRQFAGDPGS
jgi:fatty-acyl-CoA synthase